MNDIFVCAYNKDNEANGIWANTSCDIRYDYDKTGRPYEVVYGQAQFVFLGQRFSTIEDAYQSLKLYFQDPSKANPTIDSELETNLNQQRKGTPFQALAEYKRVISKNNKYRKQNSQEIAGGSKIINPLYPRDLPSDIANYFPAEVMIQLHMARFTQNPQLWHDLMNQCNNQPEKLRFFESCPDRKGEVRDAKFGCLYDPTKNKVTDGANIQGRALAEAVMRLHKQKDYWFSNSPREEPEGNYIDRPYAHGAMTQAILDQSKQGTPLKNPPDTVQGLRHWKSDQDYGKGFLKGDSTFVQERSPAKVRKRFELKRQEQEVTFSSGGTYYPHINDSDTIARAALTAYQEHNAQHSAAHSIATHIPRTLPQSPTHEQKIAQNIIAQQSDWLQSEDGIRIFKQDPMNPDEILRHSVGFDWWIFPSSTLNKGHQQFNVTYPLKSRTKEVDQSKLQSRKEIYQSLTGNQGFMQNYYLCLDKYLSCAIANPKITPFDLRIAKLFESMIGIGLNKIQTERQDIFKKAQQVFEKNKTTIETKTIDPKNQLSFLSQTSRAKIPKPKPRVLVATQVSVTEQLTSAIEVYLQPDQASLQPKTAINTALETSLDSQNDKPKPTQAYRGCGIKASFDEQNRFMIDEVFATAIGRFTFQESGQTQTLKNSWLTEDPKKEITAILVGGEFKPPAQIIDDEIAKNADNKKAGIDAGLAIIAAAFHGKQDTQFKVSNGEIEVDLSCAANNKDVFVTKDCESAKSRIAAGATGDKYNPKTHGTQAIDPNNLALNIIKSTKSASSAR